MAESSTAAALNGGTSGPPAFWVSSLLQPLLRPSLRAEEGTPAAGTLTFYSVDTPLMTVAIIFAVLSLPPQIVRCFHSVCLLRR
jgi:hypothetical protein